MTVKINSLVRLLVLAGCVCIATGLAAQDAPVSPVQGSSPSPVWVTVAPETVVTPDDHPLTGGQTLGIGSLGPQRSLLKASVRAAETLESNPVLTSTSDDSYRGFTRLGGDLKWIQYIGQDTEIQFDGAFRYDTEASVAGYDQFANADSGAIKRIIRFRTWNLLIADQANYSQSSDFGAAGMEGLGLAGTPGLQSSLTSLQPGLTPNQSILTGQVGTVANTSLIELDKHFDPRDTGTLAASYGLLHYNSSLYTDSGEASFSAGFNRAITMRDSIAFQGAFSRINFQGSGTISTESFTVLYAKRISGRISIEAGGGPQITQASVPLVNQQFLGWQATGTVRYKMRRMNLSAQGIRTVTGGAGVLTGVTVTTGQGAVSVILARYWSTSLNAGVARNQQLGSALSYDTQFASFVLNRAINRYANLFLSYDFQHQTTASVCTGPFCSNVGTNNVFGLGLAWNVRPIGID
jgi:hypothetical protein